MRIAFLTLGLLWLANMEPAQAACDCGSSYSSTAWTGQTIDILVTGDDRSVSFSWAFNSGGGDAYCGQFANGDYWVAPADGQSDITQCLFKLPNLSP